MLIPNSVDVWRTENGDYHVQWQTREANTHVNVVPLLKGGELKDGKSKDGKEGINCIQEMGGKARITGLSQKGMHYFELCDNYGTRVVAAERRLPLKGSPNFRDFGGYHTGDGRSVKWGFLYRSGHLAELESSDLELLSSLELHLICDFRHEREQRLSPNRLPIGSQARVLSLPITPGSNLSLVDEIEKNGVNREAMADRMIRVNVDLMESQADAYSRMFAGILDVPDARFLIHCTAGKDRTGFGAALILLALGVPKNAVLNDYMLTARYFDPAREFARIRIKRYFPDLTLEGFRPVLEVDELYLSSALTAMEQRYGTVERYLKQALGVAEPALKELRKRYVE